MLASPGQLALLGFGQGKLTDTPLHFARCVAAIAGGGVYCSPDLTGKATAKPRRVMQAGHAKTLLAYMRTVVAAGTGSGADYRGRSAGKTATAQSGRYVQGREVLNTYFAGVYPFDHPRYAIVVMRENGHLRRCRLLPGVSPHCIKVAVGLALLSLLWYNAHTIGGDFTCKHQS